MQFTETELRYLAVEHERYVARISPVIRARLTRRGKSESEITAYIADVPGEHILIQIRRALSRRRTRTC